MVGIVQEDLQKNNIIEELYNNHMWVTDLQYEFLCNYINQDAKKEAQFIKERCILKTISKEYGEEV